MLFVLILLALCGYNVVNAEFYSQIGQDRLLYENFFHNKKNGFFVEVGAHDGISISNTYFFEKNLNWTGICVEPLPERFEQLKKNRQCICLNRCVSEKKSKVKFIKVESDRIWTEMLSGMLETYDKRHLARLEKEIAEHGGSYKIVNVKAEPLSSILKRNGVKHIDYLSVDTEGGELGILKSINFKKVKVDVITVENNYQESDVEEFLKSVGFMLVKKIEFDDLYVNMKSDYAEKAVALKNKES